MADPRRLTLADMALVHTVAFLALEFTMDGTWEAFRRELDDLLPRVNRSLPMLDRLVVLAERLIEPKNRAAVTFIKDEIRAEIAAYHKAKAAAAIDALKTAGTEGQGT